MIKICEERQLLLKLTGPRLLQCFKELQRSFGTLCFVRLPQNAQKPFRSI